MAGAERGDGGDEHAEGGSDADDPIVEEQQRHAERTDDAQDRADEETDVKLGRRRHARLPFAARKNAHGGGEDADALK